MELCGYARVMLSLAQNHQGEQRILYQADPFALIKLISLLQQLFPIKLVPNVSGDSASLGKAGLDQLRPVVRVRYGLFL